MTEDIEFKTLEKEHFPLLHRWLNEPHVKRWYNENIDLSRIEAVIEKYTPYINGVKPTRAFIIFHAKKPIGYIQTYRINDYPEYSKHLALGEEAAGIDLYIGDADYVYKGLGSEIIKQFMKDFIFEQTDVSSCVIGPEPKNVSAIRAYKKAGFSDLKTVQLPNEPEPEYIMKHERPLV